ncbi:mucin-2-like [Gadus macrocephalus]|uniref:mucin-2-like n=1 Tax=Gadus macrocephalus TaxID=80720 RepID=UPI0028CB1A65|nr:mucin-2-like [Gadus macrocephalus]
MGSTQTPSTARSTMGSTQTPSTASSTMGSTQTPSTARSTMGSTQTPSTARSTMGSTQTPSTASSTMGSTQTPSTASSTMGSTQTPSTASSTMGSTQTPSSESTTSLMTTTNPPTAPSAPAPTFSVSVTLTQTYDEQLSNPSSQQFITLQLIVVTTCNAIYRAEYGFLFIRVIVIGFRPAGGRRMANTETLLELVFNNTAPSESIPPAEEVANVLRNATVNNSTDSLQFDATTIVVERVVTTTTTIAPTTAQPLTITAKPTATTAQPPATTAQPPAPTQTTTTAAVALANVRFGFRSVRDTFTADLLNPSSAAFRDRATTITSALEPLFRRAFGSFTRLQVAAFSQGSIITTMDAKFSSAPSSDQIVRVLTDAAGTITAFDIETNSITVNGIVTGGVSSGMNKSSAFIISSMALLSWLLVSS